MTSCDDVSYPSAYLEAVRPENRLADPNTELTSICSPVFEGDQNRNLTRPTKNGDPSRLSQLVCNDDNEGILAVNQERDTTDVVERIIIASGVDSAKAVPYRSIDGQISDDSTKSHPFSKSEHCPMTEGCDSVGSSDEQRQTSFDLEFGLHSDNFSQDNFVPAVSDDCHPNFGLNNLILLNGKRDTDSNSLLVDIDANHKEISYLENGILEAYDNFDDTEYDLAFVDDFSDTLDLPVLLKQDLVSLQEGLFHRGELDIVLSDDAQEQQLLETRNRAREAAFTAELEQRGQHRSLYATYGDLSQLAIDSHENGTDDDADELICRAHQLAALHSNSSTISTAHPSNSRALQSILLAGNEIHAYVGSDRRTHKHHAVLTKSRSLDDPFCDNSGIRISPLNSTQRGVILAESSDDEQVVDGKGVDQVSNPSVSCKNTNEDIEVNNMATVEPEIKEENVESKVENSESNLNENAENKMEVESEDASESVGSKVDIKCCDDAVVDESTPGSATDNVDECDEETNEEQQQSLTIDINTQVSNMDDKHQLMSNQLIEFADNKSIKENESFMKFLEELRSHLACSRFLMNDLVEVNSNLERKNTEIAQELEEAQDRFREGDVNDFRDLQKELEQASRNCRIMQFKLRKAEKKLEEDAMGKSDGNGKSKPKTPDLPDGDPSKDKIRDLNQQLAVAKDVSVRLHQELEMIEDKRTKLEEENQLYRKRLEDSDSTKQQLKRDLEKMRTELYRKEVEILRRKLKKEIDEETSDDIKKKIRRLTSSTTSEDEDGEYDMSRLINDLQNASEREKDLQNQLQLAEEEANSVRKTITALELDKDAIEFELERFKMRFGTLDEPKRIDNDRGVSTEREAEMRLQLMVAEQEATVMRKKILELETKNEELENSKGKEKGLPQRGSPVGGEEAMDTSTANDSLKQEIELLKKQKSELELKLQKWRDYEHVFPADENGNGNEDTEAIINLRKELLFHKNHSIEIEVKNHVLEAEVQTLKKLSEIVASGPKGKGKATENKLRAQLTVMRTEVDNMRLQVGQLQVENERLTEKQLGISHSTDDEDVEMNTCPPSACSELLKLQENVTELEEQLDELQLIVKSREMNEEKYEIEVQKVKEDMTKSNMVAASKESDLHERIRQLTSDNEDLKLQVDLQKSQIAVNNAHIEKLKHSSSGHSESAADDVFTDKSHSSEVKLNFERCLKERISHLEKQLQEERKRTRSPLDSKPDVVGETNGAVDQEDDRSPGGRDRERELLKFELNESSMLLEDMRKELEDERERRKLERAEFEKKLAEAAEDKKRIERKYIFEKESVELQRKMEGFNWKKEKTDLLRRMEEFKKKAIALQEKLNNQNDTKQSPDELSKQMQDLQRIRKRLESQLAKIDTECWKYKDQAEKAIDAIQKLTVENEELQASRDILKQERTLLHNKLSTLQVEHRETDLKIRKEREEWDIEKLQYLKQCNENNNADQFKYTQELERLKKERKNQEFQASEMEIRIEELEKKVFEREQRITSVQDTLRQMEEDWAAERRRLNENFEKELRLRAHENKIDMEEKELEVRCKIREIGELKEKIKDHEKDSSIQLKLIQDLERMQQENEAKWNNEKKELINQTRKTDTEKVKSRQAEVVSDGARKASGSKSRPVAWESERSKLVADIKSLTSTLSNKEESWKAERVKYLSDIKDLRLKLRTIEDISEQRNTELCAKLEAATEMSQSLKANENSFKDERQRLMKQIEQKDNLIEEVNKTADTLRTTLDSQREELENAKIEILEKHQREEKLLRTEAAAHKFRLESETKLFREESKYLEDQMQYEIRQRAFYETTSLESKREVGSIKSQLEVLKVELATTKADYEREALIAKRSKQLLEEIQREKREVHGQLTAETQRAEILQKHYVDDKAGWDIMRNELQSKIHRLEQQGKKKLKHDELEARLKTAWDKERIEHRRVISDLHNKTIELRRQVENSAVKWHRERAALQENFGRERKILEDDRQKAESRISELVRKYTVMEESYQRTSEMEARLLQERDLWTVERYDLQKRLQENITSRRLELSRIEALFAEMRRIRSGAGLKSPTADCGTTATSPMSVHQDLITNGTIVTPNTNETNVKNSASHARSKSVERAPSIGGANRQSKSMGRSYDKRGNLSSKDRAARARSQPDVLDSMIREPMSSPFKSSSLGRPSSRSSDGQRCVRSRSTERPVAEWVCKNEDIPRRRRNRPVLTSPGRFTVKGMLRETDRKSPSLAMDDPRYLGGMMEDSFVRTVRKALEQNQSPSRTTPPMGRTSNKSSCRGQYSDSEIGGGGSDSDSERRFTDPENGYSRPSRTLERPSRFGSSSGLLGQDIRKRSITSPQGSSSPGLSPMRSESRLPSTPPSFLIPKKQGVGSSSGTMSPSQAGMGLIPGLLPKTKSQMQAREQERLNSPNTPTGNGFKGLIGRQSPRDDSRNSSPKSSQSSAHSSPHRVSGNVYTPQHQKKDSAQRISSVTTSTRSETTTTVTSQSKTSVTTLPNKSKTKTDVSVKPVQRRTVPIASEEGFDSGSEKSPAPMQTTESPLTKYSKTTASSKSTTKSKLSVQLVPSLTSRFAKPLPANRRPPSRWLRQRTRDDVCSDSEITGGLSSRNRKNENGWNSRNENRNGVEQFQYPVLNKDERALRLFYKQRHSCETQV